MKTEDVDLRQRFDLLIDAVVDYAIYMVSLDGMVLTWNTGARRLKGYSPEEIIGKPFARFFTETDRAAGLPNKALATAALEGRFESEGWRLRKDGSRFWALAILDAIRNEAGEVAGFVKITRDLTERRLAHEELAASEERYRRLVNSVVDYAIYQLEPNGNVSSWNPGAERIKGYTADEIVGAHFSSFYTEEDQAAGLPRQALETAAREGRYLAEGWRRRKDGTRFWASVVIDPIRDDNGAIVGFAKVTRDISERLDAQRLLKQTQEQLAASQKMEAVGQLSGGIAHDFNNLLMIVQGNLETAQRLTLDSNAPNLQRAIANAMRGAQRAAALTSRLLAFSRRQALDPKPLDVNRFINGTADFLQRTLGETVSVEAIGTGGAWQVDVDANHLEVALVNLAINGRDAMPDGGRLTIDATNVYLDANYCRLHPEISPGQFVCICVTDTGTGMPADVVSRAFEPFFTTKEVGHGTGLGLSQVYGFVKQSGGHLKIYSEVGHGTTVKIYLPRLVRRMSEQSYDEQLVGEGESGETVLVVEDDDDVRTYVADVLRDLKYSVLAVPHAKAAEALLRQDRRVDLLLTDVVMPGATGTELAVVARALRPSMPILFMTGYSRNAFSGKAEPGEQFEVLQKPISQTDLAAKVRDLIDRSPQAQRSGARATKP